MELTSALKSFLVDTAHSLKGSAKRLFMARTVREFGRGGQSLAERELGWNRKTLRKGAHELRTGITCCDAFGLRGRKRAEEHLPHLKEDLKALVDSQSQQDPQFKSQRLYTRLTAPEVRRQLIAQKGYTDLQLPKAETLGNLLNDLGYHPKKVRKSLPKKRLLKPTPSLNT
jgi:hypothetical protein